MSLNVGMWVERPPCRWCHARPPVYTQLLYGVYMSVSLPGDRIHGLVASASYPDKLSPLTSLCSSKFPTGPRAQTWGDNCKQLRHLLLALVNMVSRQAELIALLLRSSLCMDESSQSIPGLRFWSSAVSVTAAASGETLGTLLWHHTQRSGALCSLSPALRALFL